MRTADLARKSAPAQRHGAGGCRALAGQKDGYASEVRHAGSFDPSPHTRAEDVSPQLGAVTSGQRGPGFACGVDTSPPRRRQGGATWRGCLSGWVIHFSTATFVHSCVPADQHFTQITHRSIHRALPWQAQGWRDRSKLSCWPWSAACVKVTGGARRARDCSPAQVARDHQRRPGPSEHRHGDYRNGAAKPACAATGAAPFLPPSRSVPVPPPIASKPSAASPRWHLPYRRPFLAAMAWSTVSWMPKTFVSPVIRKIFRIRSRVQTRSSEPL